MPDRGRARDGTDQPQTLAEMILYYSPNPNTRRLLEEYRIKFEAVHGPTDLTKRYTSTWPRAQQNWLIKHDVKRWFDGLPPFGKAYLRGIMEIEAGKGKLDDMPDDLVRLFIQREMKLDHEQRGL
jgi:hypothetical protein